MRLIQKLTIHCLMPVDGLFYVEILFEGRMAGAPQFSPAIIFKKPLEACGEIIVGYMVTEAGSRLVGVYGAQNSASVRQGFDETVGQSFA